MLTFTRTRLAVAMVLLAPAATAVAQSPDSQGVDPNAPNPLVGQRWFVDKTSWAPQHKQYRKYVRRGRKASAALVGKIALRPQFKWFGRWNEGEPGGTTGVVREYLKRVQEDQPGSVPQMAVLRHQGTRCHKRYRAGGAAQDARTRKWYRDFARGVGNARVVIGFEPDSLGTLECLVKERRYARLRTMSYGIDVLSKLPNATIYLEAGASDWESAQRTARQLRSIGIHKVRGFMLNVTHYDWTARNIRHGLDISRRVGGKPFIISTSFNGRGPVRYKRWLNRSKDMWRNANVWCHPRYRGLGIPPTTRTHNPKVDAYLYVGRPGLSGGSCNGGPLPVGSWFERRALMFGRYATTWIHPPKGTRYGFRGHRGAAFFAGDQYRR